MSKFGSRQLDAAGVRNLYVPLSVDKAFKPTPFLCDASGARVTGRQLMNVGEDRLL